MPLSSITPVASTCRLAIWHVTEQPDELAALYPQLSAAYQDATARFKSIRRRKEFLAVRALLIELSEGCLPEVRYDDNGRPWLKDGRQVSFSHTDGYAVVLMSENGEVGVDIERRTDRVAKVAHMFLREDEHMPTVEAMLVAWSAKEAVYKLFSPQKLTFQEMKVGDFTPQSSGTLKVENLKTGVAVDVDYLLKEEYVLTQCRL